MTRPRSESSTSHVNRQPYSAGPGGVTLAVRITPKSSQSAIVGLADVPGGGSALSIRIAAAPKDGEANAALIAFLSKELGIPKAHVTIASGKASRNKILRVRGNDQEIVRRLQNILGEA